MFTLPPALQSLSASRRLLVLLPLPLAVTAALAWPREQEEPYFPPVPTLAEQEDRPSSQKSALPRNAILPRRDPFRPLNHPIPKKPAMAPAVSAPETVPKPAAPAAPSVPHRLLGILTVKGERRALMAGPRGTSLLAPGDELPGQGTITAIQASSLHCEEKELPVGEVWS